ncbi:MAG: hypothetical protein R3194_11120, partial [Limnobacter sp.]|nr:hypothetical protein [Limnobacter sp.]
MTSSNKSPLWVLLPNVLVPEPLWNSTSEKQRQETFKALPADLQKALARQPSQYSTIEGLDVTEQWMYSLFESTTGLKFDQYPPWAMLHAADADVAAPDWARWWGTVGHIQVERDGVRFLPPEAMDISESDLQAFWDIATPVLKKAGWQPAAGVRQQAGGQHVLLDADQPLPMEQASPWSVQHIRLTDYLPMRDDCAHWRRMWLNLQMELNNATFNLVREKKGLPTLNCLWFWGGGQAWPVEGCMPKVCSVSQDGQYAAEKITAEANPALNRLIFWQQRLHTLQLVRSSEEFRRGGSTVYVVDFEGWGGSTDSFKALESEVLGPMKMA